MPIPDEKRPGRHGRILLAIGLLIVGAIGWSAWRSLVRPAAPDVVTARAAVGDIEKVVLATGTLEPRELVSVGAQVSGQLQELDVTIGQTVRRGDPIGRIDAEPQSNALRTAEAALADAEAQRAAQSATLEQARLAYARQRAMVAGEATSQADYEAAKAGLSSARAQLRALEARIRAAEVSVNNARVTLGYTRIVAPIDGVIVAIVTKRGQTVNSNQTAPTIVIIAKLDVMTIKAEVSEADVIGISPGLPVYFTILGDARHRYRSRLLGIDPAPETIVGRVDAAAGQSAGSTTPTAVYYNARFEVPNTDGRLRAMMTAQVSIVQEARRHVLLIPSTALGAVRPDGRAAVRVRGADGSIVERRVRIGIDNNVMAEVLDGLRAGEDVVVGDAGGQAPKQKAVQS